MTSKLHVISGQRESLKVCLSCFLSSASVNVFLPWFAAVSLPRRQAKNLGCSYNQGHPGLRVAKWGELGLNLACCRVPLWLQILLNGKRIKASQNYVPVFFFSLLFVKKTLWFIWFYRLSLLFVYYEWKTQGFKELPEESRITIRIRIRLMIIYTVLNGSRPHDCIVLAHRSYCGCT